MRWGGEHVHDIAQWPARACMRAVLFHCAAGSASVLTACPCCPASSLWNAAHDDTIPDPKSHSQTKIQGLHNANWLWNVGGQETGSAVHAITGQNTHVPFH